MKKNEYFCYNKNMKKLFLFLGCFLTGVAFAAEPLMLIKPSREVFVNFPSAILPDKAVTVFLPEPSVPLTGKYPVVYILGAVPTDAPAAQEVLARAEKKAILVGLNVEDADMQDPARIVTFFTRELIPYIDTNYPTLSQPAYRMIAANGAQGAKVAAALLGRKKLFGGAAILHSGEQVPALSGMADTGRLLASGTRAEMAAWTAQLQEQGFVFGPGFLTRFTDKSSIFDMLDLDYLFAAPADLEVVKLNGEITPHALYATPKAHATLAVEAELANAMKADVVPLQLKMSPPYLEWEAATGHLEPLPGARPGKVKITLFVDKVTYKGKIKLKK